MRIYDGGRTTFISLPHEEFRIEWDSYNRKEIENAKEIYRKARKENRLITKLDDSVVDNFNPEDSIYLIKDVELKENEIRAIILDDSGDKRFTWDSSSKKETKNAMDIFNKHLKTEGSRAYAISADGKNKRRILSFDPDAEEIVFEDKPLRESLNNFIKTFKKVSVSAGSRPG